MRRKKDDYEEIMLELGKVQGAKISYCKGPLPYLWIGSDSSGCFGTVADADIRKPYKWCGEILDSLPSRRAKAQTAPARRGGGGE